MSGDRYVQRLKCPGTEITREQNYLGAICPGAKKSEEKSVLGQKLHGTKNVPVLT